MKYRFQWNFPILFSPHDPTRPLRRRQHRLPLDQRGAELGGDQPRPDAQRQVEAGPFGRADHEGQHERRVLLHDLHRLTESPVTARRHLGRARTTGWSTSRATAARTGTNVTPKGMPEWIQINSHRRLAARRGRGLRRRDDVQVGRLPALPLQDARLRQDVEEDRPRASPTTPSRASSARTRTGAGCSTRAPRPACTSRSTTASAGSRSSSTCPIVPITDLAVHKREKDLVVATQGRSFWILDDLTGAPPVDRRAALGRRRADALQARGRLPHAGRRRRPLPPTATVGANPPRGRRRLLLPQGSAHDRRDARIPRPVGQVRPKFTARAPARPAAAGGGTAGQPGASTAPGSAQVQPPPEQPATPSGEESTELPAAARRRPRRASRPKPGLNRFVWDMRYPDATRFPGMILWAGGTQRARAPCPAPIRSGSRPTGRPLRRPSRSRKTRALQTTPEEFAKQFDAALEDTRQADRDAQRRSRRYATCAASSTTSEARRRPAEREAVVDAAGGQLDRKLTRRRGGAVPDKEPEQPGPARTSRSGSTTSWPRSAASSAAPTPRRPSSPTRSTTS